MAARLFFCLSLLAAIAACKDPEAPRHEPPTDPFVVWSAWQDCDSIHVELQVETPEPWVFCFDTGFYLRAVDGSRSIHEFATFEEFAPRWYRFTGAAALEDVGGEIIMAKAIGGRAGAVSCEPRIDAVSTIAWRPCD